MNTGCSKIATGRGAALLDMLDTRERRQDMQKALVGQYHLPVISFTLNITGPVKAFPLAMETFCGGVDLTGVRLNAWKIPVFCTRSIMAHTDCEYFWVMDGDLYFIKEALCLLEDSLGFGRLFNIDVINTDRREISRTELGFPVRRYLLRSRDAFVCDRARTHMVKELPNKEYQPMKEYSTCRHTKKLSSPSMLTLLYEVGITPKPGLVDRNNTGARRDMDVFTFEASAISLNHFFEKFVPRGMESSHESFSRTLSRLHSLDIQAEDAMMKATHNINTHKDLIFSLAITSCSLGYVYANQIPYSQDNLLSVNRRLVESVLEDLKDATTENAGTNGERLYALYGMKGAGGKALSEYHTVLKAALPMLKDYLGKGSSINNAGIVTLLHIVASSENMNTTSRSSYGETKEIQGNLGKTLQEEEIMQRRDAKVGLDVKARLAYIEDLDRDFI